MHPLRAEDPADVIVAWEAVEDLLAVVPEGTGKDVLRMTAAGWSVDEIAARLGLSAEDVSAHGARARVRVLTAAVADDGIEASIGSS
ncbi:MAG TPA: LuxR C-terminal-related transcriptional regulator [Euzebyales bacterium]|nr:LuxR C-terminal-related transcriptional regulator [Euzebyales bacterium]